MSVWAWGDAIDLSGRSRWECEPWPGWFAIVETASSGEFRWADYIITGPDGLRVEGEAVDVETSKRVVAKICEALK